MASLNDLVTDTRNAARPNSAKVSSPRSSGGATLVCDNLSGWPTASKVHFVTYQIDSSSNPVAGTQLDAVGIVSGNSITSFTVKDGTDSGNAVNDVVEMLPTAAWGQDLATALVTEHDRTGKHTNITASSITNSGNSTIGGNQTVAGTLGVTGATTLTGAVGGAGYSLATISNPYKFGVYRTAALSAAAASAWTLFAADTKLFDTSSNVDVVTNKGRFTAPIAGFYLFNGAVLVGAATNSNDFVECALYKNGSVVKFGPISRAPSASSTIDAGITGFIQLAANDYVEMFFRSSSSNALFVGDTPVSADTYFEGFLVSGT